MMPASRMMAADLFQDCVDDERITALAFAVENVMRRFAEKKGLDAREVKKWGLVGFLHDVDNQLKPDNQCYGAQEIMTAVNYDEDFIRAVMSHGYGVYTDIKPETDMEKALYLSAEFCELVYDSALALESHDIEELTVEDLVRNFNDPDFAPERNREVINRGLELTGLSLEEAASEMLDGMVEIAYALGLDPDEDDE